MSALVSHDNLPADATLSGGVGGDDGGGAAPVNRCRHRVEHVCREVRDAGDGRPSEEHGRRWLPTSAHTSCSVAQSGVLHEAIAEGSAVKCINLICQLGQELFVLEERMKKKYCYYFLSAISLNSSSFWKTFSRIFFSSSVKWAVSCSLVSEDECDCESIDSIGGRWAPVSVPATGEVEPPMGATVPDVEVIEELRCCREEALL